ncbi:MAG: WGR domain-containing protein, partial [Xenococcaceae cyanobacterium]
SRFYRIDLCQDLFGQWMIQKTWGSNRSRGPGQSIDVTCDSYEQARSLFERQEKRRRQRGYQSW